MRNFLLPLALLLATTVACGDDTTSTGGAGGQAQGGQAQGGQAQGGQAQGGQAQGGQAQGGQAQGGQAQGGAGGGCTQITNDATAIGNDCVTDQDCPLGYTCHTNSGVVVQMSCAILCTDACECPDGLACNMMSDKAGTWMECG